MPKLEWYKDAVPLSKLNNTRYKITAMILQVRKVQPDDTGIFQCFAENMAGQVQAFTNLVVTSKLTSKLEKKHIALLKCDTTRQIWCQ